MESDDAMNRLTMEMMLKKYPHIPKDRLRDLYDVGAKSDQYERSDIACQRETDGRLKSYTLVDEVAIGEAQDQFNRPRITVGVIGTSGSGKSATGNTLLGDKLFYEGASAEPITVEEKRLQSTIDSLLTVVDTPGSWKLVMANKVNKIDLYAIVVNLASPRFFKKDLETLRNLKDYNKILKSKRCILLLTHAGDALQGKSLSDYLTEIKGDPLHELIVKDMDMWRVMAINNACGTPYESEQQRKMISKIMRKTFTIADFKENTPITTGKLSIAGVIVVAVGLIVFLAVYYR